MSLRARRLLPLLIGLALILPAVVPAPVAASASDAEAMILKKMNYERTKRGLVALRLDTRLAAIARDRSEYQARTGDADHTQGSRNVFDFIQSAGIKWYAAGEIIAQNRYYPSVEDSAAAAIKGWLGSSTHRSILLSKGYNYVGFGYAMNPDNQRRYWTGVFLKGPDRTAPVAQFEGVSKSSSGGYIAIKIRWSGADRRLQVLTSGLRYFQVQRRAEGGTWKSWNYTTGDVQDGPLLPGTRTGSSASAPGTRPATGATGTPSASASDAGQPLTRPPRPSSFDTAPTTGRCRAFRGSTIRSTPPNSACARRAAAKAGTNAGSASGSKPSSNHSPTTRSTPSRRSIRGSIRPTSRSPNRIGST